MRKIILLTALESTRKILFLNVSEIHVKIVFSFTGNGGRKKKLSDLVDTVFQQNFGFILLQEGTCEKEEKTQLNC